MPRTVFTLQVDPTQLDAYRSAHAAVWPEMLRALEASGWDDYTLHLRDDGLLIGVVQLPDAAADSVRPLPGDGRPDPSVRALQDARERMEAREINVRWQDSVSALFTHDDDLAADEAMQVVPCVFDLESQLDALDPQEPCQ